MKTPSTLKRTALAAVALAVLAGSVGTTAAQAADNSRGRKSDQRQERTVKKPERARKNDRAVRNNDRRREDRRDDRAVRGRDNDRDRDRDRIVIRDRDHRGDRDRYDRRHRVVVRHRDLRACPPPRYVVRPWYRDVRRIYVHDDPFYFHAGLGIYLGGLALRLELGDLPPEGFVFYDPYCDMEFWSVSEYHRHLRYHRHPNALTVIVLDGYYLDD
jgi:hypothetical protein